MDIKCVVCGEPWDYYHLRHDAPPWVWPLFQAGAGCESCEGDPPVGEAWAPKHFEDIECGDLDPQHRITAYENYSAGKAPKWERPKDPVLWSCAGCGVEVIQNVDFDPKKSPDLAYEYNLPYKAKGAQWYSSHPYSRGEPSSEPAHKFGEDAICEFCLEHCDDCGKAICGLLEVSDVYDERASFVRPGCYLRSDSLCLDCYEKYCTRCERDECECLADMISKLERKFGIEEDIDRDEVDKWLYEHHKETGGEGLKELYVEDALFALGYLVEDNEEEQKSE